MMRVTWFGSEGCPGPAPRRRWPVSSLVRIKRNKSTSTSLITFVSLNNVSSPPPRPADCSIVGKVNGVCFTYSKEGRPSGEAFIELKTADDFKTALSKDRKYMGHRYIEGK